MSLLQLKNIHKRHLLWVKLFGICFFFHVVFLFWIFCIYHDNSSVLSLSVHKKLDYSTPIMFVPYSAPSLAKSSGGHRKATKSTSTDVKKIISPQNNKQKTVVTPPKPTTVAAVIPQQNSAQQKEIPKSEPKIQPTPEAIKKETPKIKEQTKSPVAQALDTTQMVVPTIPQNAHISHNYREVEALRKQAQLQKEIVQKWKPPIGVSPECTCDVSFFINAKGAIENIKMIKNSGVMMFDISVRQALFATKMPHWTYGKSLTINFKQ